MYSINRDINVVTYNMGTGLADFLGRNEADFDNAQKEVAKKMTHNQRGEKLHVLLLQEAAILPGAIDTNPLLLKLRELGYQLFYQKTDENKPDTIVAIDPSRFGSIKNISTAGVRDNAAVIANCIYDPNRTFCFTSMHVEGFDLNGIEHPDESRRLRAEAQAENGDFQLQTDLKRLTKNHTVVGGGDFNYDFQRYPRREKIIENSGCTVLKTNAPTHYFKLENEYRELDYFITNRPIPQTQSLISRIWTIFRGIFFDTIQEEAYHPKIQHKDPSHKDYIGLEPGEAVVTNSSDHKPSYLKLEYIPQRVVPALYKRIWNRFLEFMGLQKPKNNELRPQNETPLEVMVRDLEEKSPFIFEVTHCRGSNSSLLLKKYLLESSLSKSDSVVNMGNFYLQAIDCPSTSERGHSLKFTFHEGHFLVTRPSFSPEYQINGHRLQREKSVTLQEGDNTFYTLPGRELFKINIRRK